jgi:hypothetical protein
VTPSITVVRNTSTVGSGGAKAVQGATRTVTPALESDVGIARSWGATAMGVA